MLYSSPLLVTPALLGFLFLLPPAVARFSRAWQPSPPCDGRAVGLPHCSDTGLLAQAPNLDQDSDPDKRLILSQTELTLLEGEETFFKLRLSSRLKESEVVNVIISSNNEENIAISPSSLTFTEDNWEEWKDIKVSLKNNEIDEDSLSVVIYLSPSGSGYDENNAQDLNLTMNKPAKKLNILMSRDNTENLIEDDMKLNITEGKSLFSM